MKNQGGDQLLMLSKWQSPIHSFTHTLIYPKRTQLQNFKDRVSRIVNRELCKTNPIQPASGGSVFPKERRWILPTSDERSKTKICKTNPISKLQKSSIMNRASRICKTNPITLPQIEFRKSLTIFHSPNANFYAKIAKNARLLQILDPNTLNSIYNKDLQRYFHPTKNERRKYAKQTQLHSQRRSEAKIHRRRTKRPTGQGSRFMQNKPNFIHKGARETKNAKRTQLQPLPPRVTGHGSRVTIYPKRTQFDKRRTYA